MLFRSRLLDRDYPPSCCYDRRCVVGLCIVSRKGGSPLLSVFCGSIMCWTCGKCYGIVKRLPDSLLSKSSHHLTTVKIFRDATAPRRQRARAARRLCVGSKGPLTRSEWNINDHLQVPRLHREEVQRPIFMEPCAKK